MYTKRLNFKILGYFYTIEGVLCGDTNSFQIETVPNMIFFIYIYILISTFKE